MRIIPIITFALAFMPFACSEKKPVGQEEVVVPIPPIVDREISISSQNCNPDSLSCTYVRIEFPELTDSTKTALNEQIEHKIKVVLSGYFRDETIPGTLEEIAREFISDYEAFLVEFPTYQFGWYLTANADITYESPKFISARLHSETFTGGAHPNSSTSYFIFDAKTNKELAISDIVADTTAFKQVVEKEFRKDKGLAKDQSLADAGFWLEDGNFQLPQNIGFTTDSIIVHFNPYEIAPYSAGPTTLKIDIKELEGILNLDKID